MRTDTLNLAGIDILVERSEGRTIRGGIKHVQAAVVCYQNLVIGRIQGQSVLIRVNSAIRAKEDPDMCIAAGGLVQTYPAEPQGGGIGGRN